MPGSVKPFLRTLSLVSQHRRAKKMQTAGQPSG
jgi:hypothetical protein